MADYISREAAMQYIKDNQCKGCSDIGLCGKCAVLTALKLLENAPAADVRSVVHGEWWPAKDGYYGHVMCSVCHKIESHKTDFCPNCGANMRENNDGR